MGRKAKIKLGMKFLIQNVEQICFEHLLHNCILIEIIFTLKGAHKRELHVVGPQLMSS